MRVLAVFMQQLMIMLAAALSALLCQRTSCYHSTRIVDA
jgi:hypothetical protein